MQWAGQSKYMKEITYKRAAEEFGCLISKMQRLDRIKFYLLENGNVIDSMGDLRFIKR